MFARITLLEFGDYQSDYSTRAAHVGARLLEDFPAELRFIFKHYPLTPIHPQATEAAPRQVAEENEEARFYFNKIKTAEHYTFQILPRCLAVIAKVQSRNFAALEAVL